MNVQRFLLTRSLTDLDREHGVKARLAGHKVGLNYSQIEARDDDPISQECRGLILAPVNGSIDLDRPLGETIIVARPFNRFFNLGQGAAAPVDLDHRDTRFWEKMDGTLCILYHDPIVNEWHVGTRSVPEANLPIDGFGEFTFRTLFEKACRETTGFPFETFVTGLDPLVTYMFELTTPLNRIVVDYSDYKITLLGARDKASGAEIDPLWLAPRISVPTPPVYRFGNLGQLVEFVSSRDPKDHEGIVVCDTQYRRVKVKNPAYLALNKVRDSVMNSPRGLVELILLEKLDDTIPLLPQNIQNRSIDLRDGFRALVDKVREDFDWCKDSADSQAPIFNPQSPALVREHRKAFALAVGARKAWMAPIMDMYLGRSTDLVSWIMSKRGPDGSWSAGFLDSVLDQIERHLG